MLEDVSVIEDDNGRLRKIADEKARKKIEELETKLKGGAIYGVRFYGFGQEGETAGLRLLAASGLVAGINGAKNSFDNIYPWAGMKSAKDENGDYFTKVPLFYCKVEKGTDDKGDYTDFYVSAQAQEGFAPHCAFKRSDGTIAPYFEIGTYEATWDDDGGTNIGSKPGKVIVNQKTISEFRNLARDKGNQLMDIRQQLALNILFMVEFATRDCQSVVYGQCKGDYCSIRSAGDNYIDVCLDDLNFDNESFANYLAEAPEHYNVYFSDRKTVKKNKIVRVEGYEEDGDDYYAYLYFENPLNLDDFEGEVEFYLIQMEAGATLGKIGSTVGNNYSSPIRYRGIENLWGNLMHFYDGVLLTGSVTGTGSTKVTNQNILVSDNQNLYADVPNASYKTYKSLTYTGQNSPDDLIVGNYVGDIRIVEGFSGLCLPQKSATYASAYSGYCDQSYIQFPYTEGQAYIVYGGGWPGSDTDAGIWSIDYGSTARYYGVLGARLSKNLPEGV